MPRRYCIRALEDTRATSRDVIAAWNWSGCLLLTETVSAPRCRRVVDGREGLDEPRVGGAQLPGDGRERLERRRNVDRACKRKKDRKNNSDKSHWESVNCVRSQRRGPDALRILWLNCDIETETSALLFDFLLLFCTFGHYLRCEKPNKYWLEQDNPWARIWNVAANQMNVTAVRPKKVFMDFVKMIIICHHCKVMYSPSSTNKMNGFQPNMDLWSG